MNSAPVGAVQIGWRRSSVSTSDFLSMRTAGLYQSSSVTYYLSSNVVRERLTPFCRSDHPASPKAWPSVLRQTARNSTATPAAASGRAAGSSSDLNPATGSAGSSCNASPHPSSAGGLAAAGAAGAAGAAEGAGVVEAVGPARSGSSPVSALSVLLEGEIQARQPTAPDADLYNAGTLQSMIFSRGGDGGDDVYILCLAAVALLPYP